MLDDTTDAKLQAGSATIDQRLAGLAHTLASGFAANQALRRASLAALRAFCREVAAGRDAFVQIGDWSFGVTKPEPALRAAASNYLASGGPVSILRLVAPLGRNVALHTEMRRRFLPEPMRDGAEAEATGMLLLAAGWLLGEAKCTMAELEEFLAPGHEMEVAHA